MTPGPQKNLRVMLNRSVHTIRLSPKLALTFFIILLLIAALLHIFKLRVNIDDIHLDNIQQLVNAKGFSWDQGIFKLPGHTTGELTFLLHSPTLFRKGELYLSFMHNNVITNEIAISYNGHQWTKISQDVDYSNNRLPLTAYINGSKRFYLSFKAQNLSPLPQKVLQRIDIFLTSRAEALIIRNIFYLIILTLGMFFLLHALTVSRHLVASIVILSLLGYSLLIWIQHQLLDFSPDLLILLFSTYLFILYQRKASISLHWYLLALASLTIYLATTNFLDHQIHLIYLSLLVGAVWWGLNYLGKRSNFFISKQHFQSLFYCLYRHKYLLLLLIIMSYGAYIRIHSLNQITQYGGTMAPDALDYDQLARGFHYKNFYHPSYREPLPIMAIKTHYILLGLVRKLNWWQEEGNYFPIRSFSMLYSILVILLTYYLAKGLINPSVGIISATLVSGNYFLIFSSTQGLVTEFYMVILMSFYYFVLIENKIRINKKLFLIGILGGVLSLTRSSGLYLLIIILGYLALRDRQYRNLKLGIPIFIAILISFPFNWANKKYYGEFNFVANNHATFYKNYEFMDMVGHLPRKVVKKDPYYSGTRVTPGEYCFRYHTLPEIGKRVASGIRYVFSDRLYLFDPLITPLVLVGMPLLLLKQRFNVLFLWLLTLLPYAVFLSLNSDFRFTYESFPFMAMAAAFVLYLLHQLYLPPERTE
jgi:hypothetical protein